MNAHEIKTPLTDRLVATLEAGDLVLLSGPVYTARDAAHRRLIELLENGKELPFDLRGQIIYYTGPAPTPPGRVIGPAGPTTAGRMDRFTLPLLRAGLKGIIGKGSRGKDVIKGLKKYRAVYLAAVGGAAALLSTRIIKKETVAWPDLGPEAVLRLELESFPAVVAIDSRGKNLYSLNP